MDLTRWGLLKFTRITDRYRNFQEFLGQVLEGERSLLESADSEAGRPLIGRDGKPETPFAVRDDFERLLYSPLPSRGRAQIRAETVFQTLAPYFEAGFLLKVEPSREAMMTSAQLRSMFLFGRAFEPPEEQWPQVQISIPPIARNFVMRGRVRPLLRLFKIEAIKTLNEASVFAFTPRPGWVFLLVCNRPPPWQVGAIESAHNMVQELMLRGNVR